MVACQRLALPLRLVVLAAALAGRAAAWTVWAGPTSSGRPDLTNATTAMRSAYRFSHKRPLLRYAISPDFCAALHPLLIEEKSWTAWLSSRATNFTTCERIHAIVRDAFDVWSAANPALHFVDVSRRCEAERLWRPIPDERCAESQRCVDLEMANVTNWLDGFTALEQLPNPATWLCSHRTCFECDRAEVIVGGFTQKNRRLGDQHAAARVQRNQTSGMRPVSPSGAPALGKTLFRAFLEFNVDDKFKNLDFDPNGQGNATLDNCWRVDNGVCDYVVSLGFGAHANEMKDAIMIYFWVFFALLLCACFCIFLSLLQRLAANLLTGWDVDQDGKLEMQEILYVLDEFCGEVCFECKCPSVHQKKMSPLSGCLSVLETISQASVLLPLAIFVLLFSLALLFMDAVMPCFYCRDLRASAIHEVGHLLSLDHATGEDGTVPLVYDPGIATPAPPPPSSDAEGGGGGGGGGGHNWTSFFAYPRCDDPMDGVLIDPVATELLNPPPPPLPPPSAPPPPLSPGETIAPPPGAPPALPPNASVSEIVAWWAALEAANIPPPPNASARAETPEQSHLGRMGSLLDLNSSVMLPFGSTGLERPGAGAPRRCLDVDDLNGVQFLYPDCGLPRLPAPTCEYVLEYEYVGQRLVESWTKLMFLPIVLLVGFKLFAIGFLFFEDVLATWRVRQQAKRLLEEAEEAEEAERWQEEDWPAPESLAPGGGGGGGVRHGCEGLVVAVWLRRARDAWQQKGQRAVMNAVRSVVTLTKPGWRLRMVEARRPGWVSRLRLRSESHEYLQVGCVAPGRSRRGRRAGSYRGPSPRPWSGRGARGASRSSRAHRRRGGGAEPRLEKYRSRAGSVHGGCTGARRATGHPVAWWLVRTVGMITPQFFRDTLHSSYLRQVKRDDDDDGHRNAGVLLRPIPEVLGDGVGNVGAVMPSAPCDATGSRVLPLPALPRQLVGARQLLIVPFALALVIEELERAAQRVKALRRAVVARLVRMHAACETTVRILDFLLGCPPPDLQHLVPLFGLGAPQHARHSAVALEHEARIRLGPAQPVAQHCQHAVSRIIEALLRGDDDRFGELVHGADRGTHHSSRRVRCGTHR